jgi:type IV pilus assembly protein PilM
VFPSFKPRSLVGLDMNAEEIRLLQLRPVRKGHVVENFAIAGLPPGTIQDGKIIEFETVAAVLGRLVQQTKTAGFTAAMALPANRVISKRIKLSAGLPQAEYETTITANFPRYFPGLQEELCFDFVVFDTEAKPPEVLLVASRVEQINSYTQAALAAGLKIKIVDVDTYALVRAVSLIALPDTTTGLLDIAPEMTQLILLQRGQIVFNQHWHTPENNFLAAEIRRAIQLCATSQKTLKITECFVSGMTAKAAAIFTADLAINFVEANPFKSLAVATCVNTVELKNSASRLMVCCGLALRSMPAW